MPENIFLSYARGDDVQPFDPAASFVAKLHRDLTARGFDVWFDRVSMPSRNLTFHQEIRDAVSACNRLVLVLGPKAANSDYVRQEWQFAYFEADKVVTPILRQGDFPLVPAELKLLHCEDFRDDAQYAFHLDQLERILLEKTPRLGKLIAVPSLPAHFLARTERLTALRDALRADLDRPVVISGAAARVGMHGMAGIGKSVLAATLARDRKVREAFPDGIVWIGLGALPDLKARMQDAHRALGGDGAIATEHEGKEKLRSLLKDKSVLLVIDDAWRRSDVDAFDVLGPKCRALITTRDAGLLTSLGGVHHVVELLSDDEALRLLAVAAGVESVDLPAEARAVLAECGRLPLAVALAGGMVRAGTPWRDVCDALREHELEFLEDPHAASSQHRNLWKAMEVSVRMLPQTLEVDQYGDVQQRFAELAVFPEDETIPEGAVTTLWGHTGGLSPRVARKLMVELKQRSLVQLTRPSGTTVDSVGSLSLHDLIHDLCVQLARKSFGSDAAAHDLVVEAYRTKCPQGWHTGPDPDDGYFFQHLCHHLAGAGRTDELASLLQDLKWLEAKNQKALTFNLATDYAVAESALPRGHAQKGILRLLEEALRRDIHFIARHKDNYPQGLFQCMWNSGWWYDHPKAAQHYDQPKDGWSGGPPPWQQQGLKLWVIMERWREEREATNPGFGWLRSLRPPVTHLGTGLRAILSGHENGVESVAFSPDGRRIVSGSRDETVRVWDADSGAELLCLCGHESGVYSVALSPDGRRIVTGSDDKTVRVWDANSGAELCCLRGHEYGVQSVQFSTGARRIVSGSLDWTVRVWDADSGTELRCLRGPEKSVECVAFSPDARRIVSASRDNVVRVWDADSGAELYCLPGREYGVRSVAFSPDGRRIVGGSLDKTVRVWDAEDGAELRCLRGHEGGVTSVALSQDGRRIVSGSYDQTVRVWDAEAGVELRCLRGHEGLVTRVAFSPDGRWIVSASEDKTVRVWDAESGGELHCLCGHESWVKSMALSPDGRRIVSASGDKTVRVWDAESGAELHCLRGHESGAESVAFSPDGSRVASVGSNDETVRVWDAENGAELRCMAGHENIVSSVAFSPDGRRIVSGSYDHTVRVWDAEGGVELHCLRGHQSLVTSVVLSPDGHRIVSGSHDKTVRVWDAESGECLEVIEGNGDLSAVAAGASRFPWRAFRRGLETVVESASRGKPVAGFPIALEWILTLPSARMWAGAMENYLGLFKLEGSPHVPDGGNRY